MAASATPSRLPRMARSFWLWWADRLAYRRQRRQQYSAVRLLDAHALRDLGLDRSELDSYAAEARGWAEPTRRRVAHLQGAQPACEGLSPVPAGSHAGSHADGLTSGSLSTLKGHSHA
ncbi:hypothetical protein SAMN05216303_10975 [Rhodoferax sp. OV413]|nr:hypothetical protein SAMN05216303_10975 [Rhodoferax sp. OV413]